MKGRNIRGITLIALVITIILLLILCGVVVSQLNSGNIFDNAISVVEKSKIASKKEEIELAIVSKIVSNDGEIDIKNIIKKLEENGIIDIGNANEETGQVKTNPDGYIYEIDKKDNGEWDVSYVGKGDLVLPKIELVVLERNEDNIVVKMKGQNLSNYQFSLDGTNWSTAQSTNEYTFTGLTKVVVDATNYKTKTGMPYNVYAKVKNEKEGKEEIYGPVATKTIVEVQADASKFEYEEVNGEIRITGIATRENPFESVSELSMQKMEDILLATEELIIPSYINNKPVTQISEKLVGEMINEAGGVDDYIHVYSATYSR